MGNKILSASRSKKIDPGHGKVGYIQLNTSVRPEVKDAYIALSRRYGRSFSEEIRWALDKHLQENGA